MGKNRLSETHILVNKELGKLPMQRIPTKNLDPHNNRGSLRTGIKKVLCDTNLSRIDVNEPILANKICANHFAKQHFRSTEIKSQSTDHKMCFWSHIHNLATSPIYRTMQFAPLRRIA